MMALEQQMAETGCQPSVSRLSRPTSSNRSSSGKSTTSTALENTSQPLPPPQFSTHSLKPCAERSSTLSSANKSAVGTEPTNIPQPLPPPPVSTKRCSPRNKLSRRSSSPCSVGFKKSFSGVKAVGGKASTPTANQLSSNKQKLWTEPSNPNEDVFGEIDFSLMQSLPQGISKRFSMVESNEGSSKSSQSTHLLSPTSLAKEKCRSNSTSNIKTKHKFQTTIKLDPPPSRKSKSQSPARNRVSTSINNKSSAFHTPIHASKSAPPKKCLESTCISIKSPIHTTTLLNGFASTPPTPTVTITPTSSPPKHPFEDSFSHFIRDNCPRNGTAQFTESPREQSHKEVISSSRPSSPSRQSGIGGFEGHRKRSAQNESDVIPPLPPPPAKSKVVKLLDIGDSLDEQTNENQTQDKTLFGSALRLPDPPDLIYSGASSSEGTDSPFKLPATPVEDPESRLYPGLPSNFIFVDPNDLSDEELRDFAMRWGSPHHAPSSRSLLLAIPPPTLQRPRMTSLPAPQSEDMGDEEHYTVRHFSIIGRGIVNRGDSIKTRRSKSNTCALESLSVAP